MKKGLEFELTLRKANPHISMWWNDDRETWQGLCIHEYVGNGCHTRSYRIGGLVLDVMRPTDMTDIRQLKGL